MTLPDDEHPMVEPGQGWQAIQTPVGRLGVLIGNDMFYPEAGRMLAYGGAEMLIGLGAVTEPVHIHRQRLGLLARVEDNQVYGALSFAVGYNPFTRRRGAVHRPFADRRAGRHDPAHNGVMVEMGTDSTEGLITAEWSYQTLREHWATDDMMVRSGLPMDRVGPTLAAVYGRQLTLDQANQLTPLLEPEHVGG